jgi:hypothetical protein
VGKPTLPEKAMPRPQLPFRQHPASRLLAEWLEKRQHDALNPPYLR